MLRRRSLTFSIALLSSVTLMCGGFDETELECEEAIARLVECCPTFHTASVRCYVHGCDDTTPVTINLDDSKCILNHSCDAIRSADMCGRTDAVAYANANRSSDGTTYGSSGRATPSAGVCP